VGVRVCLAPWWNKHTLSKKLKNLHSKSQLSSFYSFRHLSVHTDGRTEKPQPRAENYPDIMNTFSVYEHAIQAAHQLNKLKKEYESRALYLKLLTEWMNALPQYQHRWGVHPAALDTTPFGASKPGDDRAGDRAKDPKPGKRA